jgi:hypothetical protein
MPGTSAPIAFFAFNRPQHTARTLAALAANAEATNTDLHVFIDGARNDSEKSTVAEVIQIAEATSGFRSIHIETSDTNKGLYRSITDGVSAVVSKVGRVIVVEDDILVSPHFLTYMNEALEHFEAEPKVGSIHGYSPPIANLPNYFFLRGADCWGWATWSDRWALFDADASNLLRKLVSQRLLPEFCASHGSRSLLHLVRRVRKRNQSWAILWHASLFLAERYTLHPGKSFVQNIGHDGSGFHSMATEVFAAPLATEYTGVQNLQIEQDETVAHALSAFMDGDGQRPKPVINRWLLAKYANAAAYLSTGWRK